MKRAIIFFGVVFLSIQSFAQKDNYGLLWKVSGKDFAKPSYIFGSMHVLDEKAFELPDTMFNLLQNCEIIALEFNPDSIFDAFFGDGLITEKSFKRKSTFPLKKGDRATFLDGYIYATAVRLGLESRSLESSVPQIFSNQGEDTARVEIESETNQVYKQLVEVYHEGNLDEIEALFPKKLRDSLMIYRNTDMVSSLVRMGKQKPVFAVAGALHLIGENGLPEQLREQGYTVEKVQSTFTGQFFKEEEELPPMPVKEFYIEEVGLKGKLSAYPSKIKSMPFDAIMGLDMQNLQVYLTMRIHNQSGITDYNEMFNIMKGRASYGEFMGSPTQGVDRKGRAYFENKLVIDESVGILRIYIIERDVIIHLVKAYNKLDEAAANNYFENLEILPIPFENDLKKWQPFHDTVGAYTARFPKEPIVFKKKNVDEHDPNYIEIANISYVSAGNYTYMIRYSDYPKGYVTDADSITMKAIFQGFPDFFGEDSTKVQFGKFKGYPSVYFNSTSRWSKAFMRGNRFYLITAAARTPGEKYPKEVEYFFRNFDLINFEKPVVTSSGFTANTFEYNVFGSQLAEVGDYGGQWEDYDSSITFYCKDTLSSTEMSVTMEYYKKYTSFTLKELELLINGFKEDGDSVLLDTTYTFNEGKLFQLHIINSHYSTSSYYNAWIIGNSIIYINFIFPKEITDVRTFNEILNSLNYIGDQPKEFILENKLPLLISDIYSSDNVRFNQALTATSYLEFDKEQAVWLINQVANHMEDNFHPDSANFSILSQLGYYSEDSDSIYNALEEIYSKALTDDARYAILIQMTRYHKSKGALFFWNLLQKNAIPIPSDSYEEVYRKVNVSYITDSLAWAKQFLPKIQGYAISDFYYRAFIDAANTVVDKDSNAYQVLLPYKEKYVNNLQLAITEVNDSGSYGYSQRLYRLSRLAEVYKNEGIENHLVDLMNSRAGAYQKVSFFPFFETHLNLIQQEWIDTMTAYPYNEMKLYATIYNTLLDKYIPKKKRKQTYIARLAMASFLEDYWEEYVEDIAQIQLLEKVDLSPYGIEGTAYMCTFKPDYDSDIKYVGVSAVQPISTKELSFNYDYCEMDYDEYSKEDYEEQKEELIRKMVKYYQSKFN